MQYIVLPVLIVLSKNCFKNVDMSVSNCAEKFLHTIVILKYKQYSNSMRICFLMKMKVLQIVECLADKVNSI